MKQKEFWMYALSGAAAGTVAGLFGAGGGLVLIPLLSALTSIEEPSLFPTSVAAILPICLISLLSTGPLSSLPWREALPYLIGSAAGGVLAGLLGKRIPVLWLHRGLGVLILWGGIRYLC